MINLAPEANFFGIGWLRDIGMDRHPSTQKDGRETTPNDTKQASTVVKGLA